MDHRSLGLLLVTLGIGAVLVGALVWAGALGWFGRLPGDLRFGSGGTRVYVPLASMLLLSLALSFVAWLVRRFT